MAIGFDVHKIPNPVAIQRLTNDLNSMPWLALMEAKVMLASPAKALSAANLTMVTDG